MPLTSHEVKSRVLSLVRKGREIAWADPWMRLGNQLMLGLWAYEGRLAGSQRYVLRHPREVDLIDQFPAFASEYMLTPKQVRFTDQRIKPWSGKSSDQIEDWAVLSEFIRNALWPGALLVHDDNVSEGALVVNVRRGDYYSVPEFRAAYGINIQAYVGAAVHQAVADGGVPASFLVVSDDIPWCREHVNAQLAAIAPVDYRPQGDPVGDLAAIIHARRLIIPNSTFSMWGGYIGDVVHPGRAVYAPWMFQRNHNGGAGEAYKPSWTVIEDISGGWDLISE